MSGQKVIIKLSAGKSENLKEFSLTKVQLSNKVCSVLEVRSSFPHYCSLNGSSQYMVVLEHLPSATSVHDKDGAKDFTVIRLVDLHNGSIYELGRPSALCCVAAYHPTEPLLAVMQQPHSILLYHIVERRCCEVLEYTGLASPLQGMQWLGSVMSKQHKSDGALDSMLLSYTNTELILFRSPQPCQRLSAEGDVVWAGSVGTLVCTVQRSGAVQLWQAGGAGVGVIPPPTALLTGGVDVTCAATLGLHTLVVGGHFPHLLLCDVEKRCYSSAFSLPATTATTSASIKGTTCSLVVVATQHAVYTEVLLVVTGDGALHLLSPSHQYELLKTLQSPTLGIERACVSGCGGWAALTYSNNTTKLYHVMSLLPQHAAELTEGVRSSEPSRDGSAVNRDPPGRDADSADLQGGAGLRNQGTDARSAISQLLHAAQHDEGCSTEGDSAGRDAGDEDVFGMRTDAGMRMDDGMRTDAGMCTDAGRQDQDKEDMKVAANKAKSVVCSTAWRRLLAAHGSFPAAQRAAVWCALLRLPRTASVHRALQRKPQHLGVRDYSAVRDEQLRQAFTSTLSCLYHWTPALAPLAWVPGFVFPFVKSLQHSPLVCFELCVALLSWWCRLWYSRRREAVTAVEALVCDAAPRLAARLVAAGVTGDTTAWPLLSTALAQVLSAQDWPVAWDHVLSQPPSYLLCLIAAFTLCLQPTIAAAETPGQITVLYRQESYLPLRRLLRTAQEVQAATHLDRGLLQRLDHVPVFPRGGLPVLDIEVLAGPASSGVRGAEVRDLRCWGLEDDEFRHRRAELRGQEERWRTALRSVRQRHFGGGGVEDVALTTAYRNAARGLLSPAHRGANAIL